MIVSLSTHFPTSRTSMAMFKLFPPFPIHPPSNCRRKKTLFFQGSLRMVLEKSPDSNALLKMRLQEWICSVKHIVNNKVFPGPTKHPMLLTEVKRATRERKGSRDTKPVQEADGKVWNEQIHYLPEKKSEDDKKGTHGLKTCSWN